MQQWMQQEMFFTCDIFSNRPDYSTTFVSLSQISKNIHSTSISDSYENIS